MRRLLLLALVGLVTPATAQVEVALPAVRHLAVLRSEADSDRAAYAAREAGITIQRAYGALFAFSTPLARAAALRDSLVAWPFIARDSAGAPCIEWDRTITTQEARKTTGLLDWGLVATGAPILWEFGLTGRGLLFGPVDSGIDSLHPDLQVVGGYTPLGSDSTAWNDAVAVCRGHGTFTGGQMASRHYGVAPDGGLFASRIFQQDFRGECTGTVFGAIAAMQHAVDRGVVAFNLSVGFPGSSGPSFSYVLNDLASRAIVVTGSAGNSGTASLNAPANTPPAIGVGSFGPGPYRPGYSQTGPELLLLAPGEGITSTMPGGGAAAKSGTSMAAPWVAGVAAMLIHTPEMQRVAVGRRVDSTRTLLCVSAEDVGALGRDNESGCGLLRVDRALAALRGGAIASWTARTYPTTTIDSVAIACTKGCAITSVGDLTILRREPWLVFQARGPATLSIGSLP